MRKEKIVQTRRRFLGRLALGGTLGWSLPSFHVQTSLLSAAGAADQADPERAQPGRDGAVLVVLHMAGGNDGLNTVVPFANDHYRRARPKLALPVKGLLALDDTLGLHPALTGLKALYDQGQLAVVQGVGYPNPSRSHLRSTEIWQTASDSDRTETRGWLGRYVGRACPGCDASIVISIGRQMPQAFAAQRPFGVALTKLQDYRFIKSDQPGRGEWEMSEAAYRKLNQPGEAQNAAGGAAGPGSALEYLERVARDAQASSDRIQAIKAPLPSQPPYPPGKLAGSLRLVAHLIGGGLPTAVYFLIQEGYDTHANQAPTQERLLKELGDSIEAFFRDIRAQGNSDRVVLMTFSEFGRRMAENGSGGTDHGAASVLFLAGSRVKGGLRGAYPSLAPQDLHRGDLKYTVDFRSVYAALLENWLKTPSPPILGRDFEPLPLII